MLDAALQRELRELLAGRVAFDEPLARHTSLRVGGPADALVRVAARDELVSLQAWCARHRLPLHVLGAGFNTLGDALGVRGVVVRLAGLRAVERAGASRVRAEGGATHTQVTRFCLETGLSGLEFGVGIPGTVGGWIAMNAGTREREMREVVERVELLEVGGRVRECPGSDLRFAYRQADLPRGAIVLSATFHLMPDDVEQIRERMHAQLEQRRGSQPIDRLSCGSVFRNPPGDHAARLIEAAGLKGARHGGAEISNVHANFIVNVQAASSDDVEALIQRAREEVLQKFGIRLQTEVRHLGGSR